MADDSKTEKATPKKRRDERKEGHVFSSKDVIVVVSLLGTFYGLQILFPTIYKTIRENLLYYLNNALAIEELSMAQLSAFGIDAMQVLGDLHSSTWIYFDRAGSCGNGRSDKIYFYRKISGVQVEQSEYYQGN